MNKLAQALLPLMFLLLTVGQVSAQINFNDPSASDKATFDKILEPVMKVYGLLKYGATAVAAIFLVIAGISWMASGDDIKKRDSAKGKVGLIIGGMAVIWAAPFIVNLIAA